MRIGWAAGVGCALGLHALFLLFGGLIVPAAKPGHATTRQVDLLGDLDSVKPQDEPEAKPPEPPEELEADADQPPDAAELLADAQPDPLDRAPELAAASLSSIEAALSGQGGNGGEFGSSLNFASGGRIGGTGKAGGTEDPLEGAFSLAEIDQKPRVVYQAGPLFPAEMRGRKVEGVVSVIFLVDTAGKVANPRAEKSSHPAFEAPALDAVKQWRFEPAVRGGERVPCKMRISIRFPAS